MSWPDDIHDQTQRALQRSLDEALHIYSETHRVPVDQLEAHYNGVEDDGHVTWLVHPRGAFHRYDNGDQLPEPLATWMPWARDGGRLDLGITREPAGLPPLVDQFTFFEESFVGLVPLGGSAEYRLSDFNPTPIPRWRLIRRLRNRTRRG